MSEPMTSDSTTGGAGTPWQLLMFSRTLKKKLRLAALRQILGGPLPGQRCLLVTCGDNNGAINYLLREQGGQWSWADCEEKSLAEMAALLGEAVTHVQPGRLPYQDGQFDCVVTIDVHEHLGDPEAFTREVRRVLTPGGRAVVTVPGGDQRKLVNRLKSAVGMTRERYGHVRDGFSVAELQALLRRAGIEPARELTFSRFFTELIELGINYVYVTRLAAARSRAAGAGPIAPATAEQLQRVRRVYLMYSVIYPVVWAGSRLDWLLLLTDGYVVLVEGIKEPGR
jgi:SAM-dependent methyltransferase